MYVSCGTYIHNTTSSGKGDIYWLRDSKGLKKKLSTESLAEEFLSGEDTHLHPPEGHLVMYKVMPEWM